MITITSLSKTYASAPVLRDVSLEIRKGETIVILGHSGSGKTTLLRCLMGLAGFESGKLAVDTIELSPNQPRPQRQAAIAEIRRRCGIIFQQYHLFPHLSALKNVTLAPVEVLKQPRETAIKKAEHLLSSVGLHKKITHRPFQLSGGEQQRVAIARALAMEPAYLLYDEPTSALDTQRTREIWQIMANLAEQGQTQIIVTHQEEIQEALPCRVIRMAEGQVVNNPIQL